MINIVCTPHFYKNTEKFLYPPTFQRAGTIWDRGTGVGGRVRVLWLGIQVFRVGVGFWGSRIRFTRPGSRFGCRGSGFGAQDWDLVWSGWGLGVRVGFGGRGRVLGLEVWFCESGVGFWGSGSSFGGRGNRSVGNIFPSESPRKYWLPHFISPA